MPCGLLFRLQHVRRLALVLSLGATTPSARCHWQCRCARRAPPDSLSASICRAACDVGSALVPSAEAEHCPRRLSRGRGVEKGAQAARSAQLPYGCTVYDRTAKPPYGGTVGRPHQSLDKFFCFCFLLL